MGRKQKKTDSSHEHDNGSDIESSSNENKNVKQRVDSPSDNCEIDVVNVGKCPMKSQHGNEDIALKTSTSDEIHFYTQKRDGNRVWQDYHTCLDDSRGLGHEHQCVVWSEPILHQMSNQYFRLRYTMIDGAPRFIDIQGDNNHDNAYETGEIDYDMILEELLKKQDDRKVQDIIDLVTTKKNLDKIQKTVMSTSECYGVVENSLKHNDKTQGVNDTDRHVITPGKPPCLLFQDDGERIDGIMNTCDKSRGDCDKLTVSDREHHEPIPNQMTVHVTVHRDSEFIHPDGDSRAPLDKQDVNNNEVDKTSLSVTEQPDSLNQHDQTNLGSNTPLLTVTEQSDAPRSSMNMCVLDKQDGNNNKDVEKTY